MSFQHLDFRMNYCPRCGRITIVDSNKCYVCEHETFDINPKWGLTVEKYLEITQQVKYGEKTQEQCDKERDEYFREFREEVVKKHPDYDPYLFEHREEIAKKKADEYWNAPSQLPKVMQDAIKNSVNSPIVTCPYCKSIDTKKLTAVSRGLSFSFFGFGSSKVGKQWHCNKCGSDF